MKRAAEWQEQLTEEVYLRLCECRTTKDDIVELTRAFKYYDTKGNNMTIEDALTYMLEWVLDWNGGNWDYTEDEYISWLKAI